MRTTTHPILTIGHSTQSLEAFLAHLDRHGVTALADVRSAPYSKYNAQFDRETLADVLKARGIEYVFLGRELGARSDDPSCYKDGRVQYRRLARRDLFRAGLQRIIGGAETHRIALMCAEKEPLDCHRTLLVARALSERGIPVQHILADGRLEPHEKTMERIFDVVGLPRQDLFRTPDELLADALARQEERIAYVDESLVGDTDG